ncbi:P-loop containing nucleoside triphosphate hydrolase protein [Cladochytrium replicatum]|nr:P-loop containing nucleoside triphosphate hydrolase protein [Cladochytrium replicatum]
MPDARPSRNEHQRPPDEVDTLDAYMVDVDEEVKKITEEELIASHAAREKKAQDAAAAAEAAMNGANEEDEVDANNTKEDDVGSDPEDIIAAAAKKIAAKKKDLAQVDHSAINYEPFRKNFLVEPPELAAATPAEVEMMRAELDGIKIRGKDCPKPVQKWTQFGLPPGANEVIRKVLKYEKPTSIQAQAIPAIMSGRDVIGIAKTGSGKTIAFLLPMFRHIKDQRQLDNGEGPVGLIMTPTRELAVQIYKECKQFTKILGLRAVCAYGGSPIKDQIDDLKRGAEIIICTPGRIIDLLTANRGRVTNLRRVTYLVLDEADRMFDMGFEPQVMKIVNNVRPGRQTVLFSATFPRQMEALARKILTRPLEITVGGRSVVAADVTQIVEVRDEDTKFVRLLEILGNTFTDDPEAKVLVFVDRHEAADNLLRDLLRRGYPCQTLHGGKDQMDRDSTIADFKTGATNVLIATSVAARGLDVKQLKVVVNFECPNHMEDYVHRVGRTGRAGHKGTAYTFITSDQDRFAQDIVKALKMSGSEVAPDLLKLAENFNAKVQAGSAKQASSGFGGKGLEKLDAHRDFVKKIQKKSMGGELAEEDEDEEDEASAAATAAAEAKFEVKPGGAAVDTSGTGDGAGAHNAIRAAQEAAARIVGGTGAERAQDIIARINSRFNQTGTGGAGTEGAASFSYEIEINDYPQKARWKVTNKEQIVQITEISGAAITTRGTYIPPGKVAGPGERKLYLVIEGDSQMVIDMAKNEIKRILTEATVASMEMEAAGGGRFKVV